jgi:cation diffusion facilitator family transporter
MPVDDLHPWKHEHRFDSGNVAGERGARYVMWLTLAMMVVEIVAGWWFNSMALLADGWHMSSHALAIGLSAFAYAAARGHADDRRYAFGTWKMEVLAGFASAILLLGIAALMVYSSAERIIAPQPIHYLEAMAVAAVGLVVNLVSAWILGAAHHHHDGAHAHGDPHHDEHGHDHHHDLNLKSAYLHVIADAATSVLAIVALAGGWLYGWSWLDPAMGIVGALLVAIWARGLIAETSDVLLDREMNHPVVEEIRDVIRQRGHPDTQATDLHVWRVGKSAYACAISLVSSDVDLTPGVVREWLAIHSEIAHTTIEIQRRE